MSLTAAQREIRDLARSFARERIAPRAGGYPEARSSGRDRVDRRFGEFHDRANVVAGVESSVPDGI